LSSIFYSIELIELVIAAAESKGTLLTVLAYMEVSSVKLFVTFISFQTTTLAVLSLNLSCLNLQL